MRRWIRETHNQTLCRMQMILWGDSYTSITLVPINVGPIPETCVVLIPCLGRSHSTHSSLDLKDNQKWMKFLKFRLSPAGQVQFTVPSHSLEVNYQKPVICGQKPYPHYDFQSPRGKAMGVHKSSSGLSGERLWTHLPTVPTAAHHELFLYHMSM